LPASHGDSHTALSTTQEDDFLGNVAAVEPSADPIRFEETIGGIGGPPEVGQFAAPAFLIRTMRDPDGANLDRIQAVKGWLAAAGNTHEVGDVLDRIGERARTRPARAVFATATRSRTR
jgi:hypothetical protein